MIREKLAKYIASGIEKLQKAAKLPADLNFAIHVEKTKAEFGDYSSNIAFALAKKAGRDVVEVAHELSDAIAEQSGDEVDGITIVNGHINFTLKTEYVKNELKKIAKDDNYGTLRTFKGKKVMVEYTDANPFKPLHIGHMMTNAIGETIANLYEASGAEVIRANYYADVGIHVAKAVWSMRQNKDSMPGDDANMATKIKYLGDCYISGNAKYESDESAKKEIEEINKKIYERSDGEIMDLYEEGKRWSLEYFDTIYRRLGSRFDRFFPESEVSGIGLELVKQHPQVFAQSEGAIVFPESISGLHTRVFVNKMGLPTYEAKELGLNKLKFDLFGPDKSIVVTGNEIKEYFEVLKKAMEIVIPEAGKNTIHLPHGMLKLTTGKMASRKGNIITAEKLINDVKAIIRERIREMEELSDEEKEEIAENVAIAAIKYSILKQGIGRDIIFDPQKALSYDGDSGPYLQYTYARLANIVLKAGIEDGISESQKKADIGLIEDETEFDIAKHLLDFPYSVGLSLERHAPNHLALYLYELANKINKFYERVRVLEDENTKRKDARLAFIETVMSVMARGLGILGIKTLHRM